MQTYELMTIFVPGAGEDEKPKLDTVEALIKQSKGKVLNTDEWGEKSFSYQIAGYDRGYYVVYQIEMPADKVNSLTQKLKHEKQLLRHLLILSESSKVEITT